MKNNSRREFLKNLALAGLGFIAAPSVMGAEKNAGTGIPVTGTSLGSPAFPELRERPAGAKSVLSLTTDPRERVRVGLIGGGEHRHQTLRNIPFAEIVGVSDTGALGNSSREELYVRDDIDVLYVSGSVSEILPVALAAMREGKHVFIDPIGGLPVGACWDLVDASELSQRHCVMLDSHCFGDEALFVLNMAQEGVFGDLKQVECVYENRDNADTDARRCGMGTAFRILDLNRSDRPETLVAMASTFRPGKRENDSILIKTTKGRMIAAHRNLVPERLHSRIHTLAGTDGAFFGFPSRIALKDPGKYEFIGNNGATWLNRDEYAAMFKRFRHPLWKTVGVDAAGNGYGGQDFLMNFRLLDCIRRGLTPDLTVYDLALQASLDAIAEHSIALGSAPVRMPDFTRRDSEKG